MSRLLIVSNRLPITVRPGAAVEVEPSSGGLVSALAGVVDLEEFESTLWIGWPGAYAANEAEEKRLTALVQEESVMRISMFPVWLTKTDVEDYYNGFSNSSLWPLLHWMTPYARFKKAWAESYRRVNGLFADAVLRVARPDDVIWVQDFHLFLVPKLLRRRRDPIALLREPSVSAGSERSRDLPLHEEESYMTPTSASRLGQTQDTQSPCTPPGDLLQGPEMPEEDRWGGHFDRISGVWRSPGRMEGEPSWKLKVGFFLHVPFPSYEVICALPQCADIIEGMLGADLVGFHTYSYLRHFRSCIVRLCGFAPEIDRVEHRGHTTKLGVYPIGANCDMLYKAMRTPRFVEDLSNYTTQFQGRSLVLSVERLDYSKGMPQKLAAIERYLELVAEAEKAKARREEERFRREEAEEEERDEEESREAKGEDATSTSRAAKQGRLGDLLKRFERRKAARGTDTRWRWGASLKRLAVAAGMTFGQPPQLDHTQTVFLFLAVPSRQEVDQYKQIELEVHRRISDINGRFSTPSYQPIVYIHRGVPMEELAALYARADCCMVTPLIDGMNLVAKEFLVAKDRQTKQVVPGTIVLSELAGAAQELFDAVVVNPYDEDAVAEAIALSLEVTRGGHLDEDLRWEVCENMRKACLESDSSAWARTFLGALTNGGSPRALGADKQPTLRRGATLPVLKDSVASLFFESNPGAKAIILDYDGTLREFEPHAEDAVPSEEAARLFQDLADRQDLRVFVMSGRSKDFLEAHFGKYMPFTLIAGHGHFERGPNTMFEWRMFNPYTNTDWIGKVKPIMELFTRCTPESSIDVRDSAILWHYGNCDVEYGQFKAKELMHQLALSLGNLPCMICQGPSTVEVCSLRVQKGSIVQSICLERERAGQPFSEVLCAGDDESDESMFVEAPETAWTVKVGPGATQARHRLPSPADVRRFLRIVADQRLPGTCTPKTTFSTLSEDVGVLDRSEDRFRTCDEDPRDQAASPWTRRRSSSDADGDPLQDLPEQETCEDCSG